MYIIIAVDPKHGYSNEAEISNQEINDDFKLKKLWSPWFTQKYFSAVRVSELIDGRN